MIGSILSAYIVGSRGQRRTSTSSNGFALVLALLSLGLVMAAVSLHNAHWPYVSTAAKIAWSLCAVTFFCGMVKPQGRAITTLAVAFLVTLCAGIVSGIAAL